MDELETTQTEQTTSVPESTEATSVDSTQTQEVQGYTPNLKFKVLGEEKNFDDFLAPVIKDADTEKKIRELYERSYGLDAVKADREELKAKLSEVDPQYRELVSQLGKASKALESGDFEALGETLGLDEQTVLKWAHSLLLKHEMPEEQKTLYARNREYQKELEKLRAERDQLTQSQSQQLVQQRAAELDSAMSKPDVAAVVRQYNESVNNPQAFRDAVIGYGQAMSNQGYDIPAEEAVGAIVQQLRAINPQFGVVAAKPNIAVPSSKATLPSFKGSGASPIKQRPRSIDDIRKIARSFQEEL